MAGLSETDVFGSGTPSVKLSDADVFSAPAPAPIPQPSSGVSDAQVFGSPSLIDYPIEAGKAAIKGGVEAGIASPLRGAAVQPPSTRVNQFAFSPGELELMDQNFREGLTREQIVGHPFYQAGEAVSGAVSKVLPENDIFPKVGGKDPIRDLAGGFGSVGANIASMMLAPTFSIATMPLQGAGEATERAVKANATPEQIQRAGQLGNVAGATEFADALLPHLGSWGKVAGLMKKVGVNTLKGVFIEGGQEGLQQFIQNAIAKGVYKPDQSLSEDVAYNFVIGGIVGGTVSGGMTRREAPVMAPTSETINASVAPPMVAPELPVPGQSAVTAPDPRLVLPQEPVTVQAPITPAPLPTPLTVEEIKAKTLSPEIVDHIQKQVPPLAIPETQPGFDQLVGPPQTQDVALRENIKSAPGANTARLAKLLGPKLYGEPTDITTVSVKEMFQNSFDALKASLEQGKDPAGNIDINMDPKTRTVSVQDDGTGMTPQVLAKQFLEIAGTNKETKRASGGLGIAKMLFIFGNKNLHVTTMRDGKVAELNTTGEQLFSALDDIKHAPNINVRTPTNQDLRMFPKGRGTRVEVRVPDAYQDPSTGETKKIAFDTWDGAHPVLRNSPLFGNISVKFNGEELALGSQFPIEDYTQFANVKFDWGTARVYVSQNETKQYGNHVHILSNGLWQFSTKIKKNPNDWMSDNVPRQIYIDINPKVNPEDAGYPFDLNRQGFSPTTKKGFENLTKYIGLLYAQQDFRESAHNFGTMQFLDYDASTKSVSASHTIQIEPKAPPPPDAVSLIPQGKIESVSVVDGELRVNGRKIPDLTPDVLEKFQINPASLRVDQSEIDPSRVILHDNVEVVVSPSETRSIVDYGREKFGRRFDEYVFAIGNAFRELRDVVVKGMPATAVGQNKPPLGLSPEAVAMWHRAQDDNGYKALGTEGIGISFDAEYRGVSITIPFHGMFLNPVVPEYTDVMRAAVGMVGTMVHELAHHKVRSHDAQFPAEMQRIYIMLDTSTEFNLHAFKQKVINIVNGYHDVLMHINGVFTSGDFTTRPRGKRFEDSSAQQTGNGGPLGNMGEPGAQSESGNRLSDWVAQGQTIPPGESGRTGASYQTGSSRSHRPPDNGRGRNYGTLRSIDPGISAPPQQPEVNILRQTIANSPVGGGVVPPVLKEAASHADRFNWLYKFTAGITQLLDGNPYFQPLRRYVERARQMHSDESTVWDAAMSLEKKYWRPLGAQRENLEALIFDLQDMPYLTPGERSMNLWRHPTAAEMTALVTKHKVSNAALDVYNRMRQMDETFLRLQEDELKAAAARTIQDPVRLSAKIDQIEAYGRQARAQPFFPFTRFGRYYAVVKDAAGKVLHFETFEPRRVGGVVTKRAEKYQQARKKELERKLNPGEVVETGVLPETAEPFLGQNPLMLQALLDNNVGLTGDQIAAIKLMQNIRNPAMALKQRAFYGDRSVTGVSRDLPRSFAKYYFYGGRYYAKMRHIWALKAHVAEARLSPGNKEGLIASYLQDHLDNNILDAKGDFGFWKGAIFLWAMGYSVAAATTNLTQTPFVSYPFLSGKFGDFRAAKHLVKAMLDVTNFYRRGHYTEPSKTTSLSFEMKALGYGIKTGRVSETQAAEIAGLAGGGKLISGVGGGRIEQAAAQFQEKAAWAFEMAEQFNRRVVFRAALRLAQESPTARFVNESAQKYQSEFELLQKGSSTQTPFTEAEARAIVTAIHSTDQTQFVYAKHARSMLFRGKKNILFVFKQYVQSLLWMLGNNKADVLPRYLIIAMLMGGLGGIPGYDDIKGIIRAIGIWFFGKDVNLDRMIRDWALQWFNGTVPPDILLHGLARRGFGLPAMADMMGSVFTGQPGRGLLDPKNQHSTNVPYPVLDRSKAIGVGNILPLDVGKLATPTDKLDKTISDETQRASGAVFSVGFNMYKAIMDQDSPWNDLKRWEKAMPRALGSASRMYRAFNEGRERGGHGGPNSATTIVPYDVRDTEQMMEALAMGLGYQPLRQQAKWDIIMAQAEASAFYDMRKKNLLEEYFEAMKGKDPKEVDGVRDAIIKYNHELPDYAKAQAISGDTIKKSMGTRERTLVSRELGIPVQRSKIGISQEMQRLFPEATIDVRRVR